MAIFIIMIVTRYRRLWSSSHYFSSWFWFASWFWLGTKGFGLVDQAVKSSTAQAATWGEVRGSRPIKILRGRRGRVKKERRYRMLLQEQLDVSFHSKWPVSSWRHAPGGQRSTSPRSRETSGWRRGNLHLLQFLQNSSLQSPQSHRQGERHLEWGISKKKKTWTWKEVSRHANLLYGWKVKLLRRKKNIGGGKGPSPLEGELT